MGVFQFVGFVCPGVRRLVERPTPNSGISVRRPERRQTLGEVLPTF